MFSLSGKIKSTDTLFALFLFSSLIFSFAWVTKVSARDVQIDLSGDSGSKAKDGECCGNLPRTSSKHQTPKQGDDARKGSKGENSAHADLHLKELNGHVMIHGNIYSDNSKSIEKIRNELTFSSTLFIDARGGPGVRGGYGGDGQDGCHGEHGDDATPYSNAKRGKNGCPGASNGKGTPGTNGGNGGRVKIYIPRAQTHLSLMVKVDVRAGSGGEPGRDGNVGDGGDRGRGGDGITYTDGYRRKEECWWVPDPISPSGGSGSGGGIRNLGNGYDSFESYLIPQEELLPALQDNQTTKFAGVAEVIFPILGVSSAQAGQKCEWRNEPIEKSRPSASDGRAGPDGRRRYGDLDSGHSGTDGSSKFIVVDENGNEVSYQHPFNLRLVDYDIRDSAPGGNNDGIFEPGEELTVSRIIVRNERGMPSPELADVILSISSGQWIITDPMDNVKIPALDSGETVELDKTFKAQVKAAFPTGKGESWQISETIVSMGSIPKIRKTVSGLKLPKTIHISYPIEITPIQSVTAVGPGEKASFKWRLTNLSRADFRGLGGAERKLKLQLKRFGGTANSDAIKTFDFTLNRTAPEQQFLRVLTQLKAKESIIISGDVKFSKQAEPYTYVDFQSSLGLEVLGSKDIVNVLNHQHRIHIAQTYRYSPDASLLLLAHEGVASEEYRSWLNLFNDLGLKADVWDINYNKGLNLAKDLTGPSSGKSLLANYRDKTIVVLNSRLPRERGQRALRLLDQSQFYHSALTAGIHFYVVGGDKEQLQSELTALHLSPLAGGLSSLSAKEFIDQSEEKPIHEVLKGNKALRASPNSIKDLDRSLKAQPTSGYSLALTMNEQGHLAPRLVPSLSVSNGGMVATAAADNLIHSDQFIRGDENVRQLMLALSLRQKIKVFQHLGKKSNSPQGNYLKHISSTLIHDLVESLYLYRIAKTSKAMAQADHLRPFELFQKLFVQLLKNGDLSNLAFQEAGRIVAAAESFTQLSDNKDLKKRVDSLTAKVNKFSTLNSSRKHYFSAYKDYAKKRKKALKGNFDKTFDAYKMFTLPVRGHSVSVDLLNIFRPIYLGRSQ